MTTPFVPSNAQLIDPGTITAPAHTPPQISTAVAVASAMITGYTGRQLISATTTSVLTASADGFQLPEWPVSAVTSVSLLTDQGWAVVDPTTYTVDENGWVALEFAALNTPTSLGGMTAAPLVPDFGWQVQATYTAGYSAVPSEIATVCTHLATQYLDNPFGAIEQKVGEIADRYAPAEAGQYEPWVRAILDRYVDVGVS